MVTECSICRRVLSEERQRAGETTCGQCQLCTICGAEFPEERARLGEKLCANCDLADDPVADRYPKYREWIDREITRVLRDAIPVITDFVLAVDQGDIVAKDARAEIDLLRVAAWFVEFLNFSPAADASMDKVMGLRGVGRAPALKAAWEHRLDRMLFQDMILIRALDDVDTEKAAEMVCAAYQKADPVAWQEWATEPGALAQRFRKAGLAHPDFVAFARRELGSPSEEDVSLSLDHFPDDVLTENLKARKKNFQRQRRPI